MPEIKEGYLDYWEEDKQTEVDSLVSLKLLTRNTRLIEQRKAKGANQLQMSKDIGMSLLKLSHIENLRLIPTDIDQEKIATYLGQPGDYLFPAILMKAIEEGVFERRDAQLAEPEIISLSEAQQLRLTYDGEGEIIDEVSRHLLREELEEVLETLKPREAEVLRLRFGLKDGQSRTLEEVAWVFDVTRSQIQQMEGKALRILRHPSRSRRLKDYLE